MLQWYKLTYQRVGVVSKATQNRLKFLNMKEENFIFENDQALRKYLTSSVIITERTFNHTLVNPVIKN